MVFKTTFSFYSSVSQIKLSSPTAPTLQIAIAQLNCCSVMCPITFSLPWQRNFKRF